jgi:hypothetical protein
MSHAFYRLVSAIAATCLVAGIACSTAPTQTSGSAFAPEQAELVAKPDYGGGICIPLENVCFGQPKPCCGGGACSGVHGTCACVSPTVDCSGACVDTQSDVNNCGSCGNVCPSNSTGCSGGVCQCDSGVPNYCPPGGKNPDTCVNFQTDPNNCGSCGNVCSSGDTCCGGTCTNLASDPNHCGSCTTTCSSPNGLCESSTCCGATEGQHVNDTNPQTLCCPPTTPFAGDALGPGGCCLSTQKWNAYEGCCTTNGSTCL